MYQERAVPFASGFSLNVNTRKMQEADASLPKPSARQSSSPVLGKLGTRELASCMGIQKPAEYDPNTHTFKNMAKQNVALRIRPSPRQMLPPHASPGTLGMRNAGQRSGVAVVSRS